MTNEDIDFYCGILFCDKLIMYVVLALGMYRKHINTFGSYTLTLIVGHDSPCNFQYVQNISYYVEVALTDFVYILTKSYCL